MAVEAEGSTLQAGESVYHTVTTPRSAQGVLSRINPKFFNTRSRFGEAFYLSEVPDTTLAELSAHNSVGTQTIRYLFDRRSAQLLDLTNPRIAEIWGYERGPITAFTKSVGFRAQRAGFDVIRFPSERGPGANLAVLKNFDAIIKPQMIVPSPELDPEFLSEELWASPVLGGQ